MKIELGKVYEIEWQDHFSTTDKKPEEAIDMEVSMTSWGRCVGMSKKYIILAQNWEHNTSDNNDNIHIIKKCILNIRGLK